MKKIIRNWFLLTFGYCEGLSSGEVLVKDRQVACLSDTKPQAKYQRCDYKGLGQTNTRDPNNNLIEYFQKQFSQVKTNKQTNSQNYNKNKK